MKEYHILSLSGGKDSTALAFFMKEYKPEIFEKIELVFCDTECELPETYDYLNKIEVFLNKKITRLKPEKSFEHYMSIYNHLPSIAQRWCTVELKTKVFRKYVDKIFKKSGKGIIYLYIGIRADEAKRTENSKNKDECIKAIYPFVENSLFKKDIESILENCGIGIPEYYKWRKRSGCYFCFFQSKNDWLNLYEHHPLLYNEAMKYEFDICSSDRKKRFGWNLDMSLEDMIKPENIKKIREDYIALYNKRKSKNTFDKDLLIDIM